MFSDSLFSSTLSEDISQADDQLLKIDALLDGLHRDARQGNFKTYFGREDVMIQSNTMYGVKTIVGTAGYNLIDYINCNLNTLMPSFEDVKNSIEGYKKDRNKLKTPRARNTI